MSEPSGVGTPPEPSMHARISRSVGYARPGYPPDIDEYIDADGAAYGERVHGYYARVWKAMQLAHNVVTCRALLRGERVPVTALDYFQGARYGLRSRNAEGRYTLEDFNDIPSA
jgi:hypothetical protein